jgi:hypothetical protein
MERMANEKPWYAPGHVADLRSEIYTPRVRESIWTLTKAGRRVDCALLVHGESYGRECQCLHDGELAYGQRFIMKAGALAEADAQRRRLVGEGWSAPVTSHPSEG